MKRNISGIAQYLPVHTFSPGVRSTFSYDFGELGVDSDSYKDKFASLGITIHALMQLPLYPYFDSFFLFGLGGGYSLTFLDDYTAHGGNTSAFLEYHYALSIRDSCFLGIKAIYEKSGKYKYDADNKSSELHGEILKTENGAVKTNTSGIEIYIGYTYAFSI